MEEAALPDLPRGLTRRTFLRRVAPLPLLLAAAPALGGPRRLRFGLISDVHQDVMPDGVERVGAFVADMQASGADFIIQLGDFCQPHARNAPFLAAWNAFEGARYHVLGNHDMDGGASREKTVEFYGMPGRHYAFDAGPLRGIVLDGNDPGGRAGGYRRFIAAEQQAWLRRELEQTDRPVCLFLHQPLDRPAAGVENGEAVRAILERAEAARPGTVLAVFAGHFHQDYQWHAKGIPCTTNKQDRELFHKVLTLTSSGSSHWLAALPPCVQINSASYVWLPAAAARETYPAEVHRAHPYLRRVAAYRAPLWALATLDLDRGELLLEGRRSEWVGPDPWERGAPEDQYPRDKSRPAISDRQLALRHPPIAQPQS
ncbi:MAG: metallophosphoesterase family protein [Thermoguttaceae bacterium]